MKLRNEMLQGESVLGNAKFWGVALDPLEQIDGPAAGNVVGNLDHFDLLVLYRGKEDIVHVHEPNWISAWTRRG